VTTTAVLALLASTISPAHAAPADAEIKPDMALAVQKRFWKPIDHGAL